MKCFLLPVLLLCSLVSAQDVLVVERQGDVAARNRLALSLGKIRFALDLTDANPEAVCRYLSAVTGDKVNFLLRGREELDGVESLTLRMPRADALTAMSAIQTATGLRFVYRAGVVFLTRAEDVEPLTFLRTYDLRGPTHPIPNFPGPRLELGGSGGEVLFPPEAEESSTTVCGFSADQVEELIRTHVTPEDWDTGGVHVSNQNGLFLVRHTRRGHAEVRKLLYVLGVLEPPLPRLPARLRR